MAFHLNKLKSLPLIKLCATFNYIGSNGLREDEDVKVYNNDDSNNRQRTNLDKKSSLEPSDQGSQKGILLGIIPNR